MTDVRRPNILMILSDDHASRTISAYGSDIISTPRIDEIASEGWRFDNCFATNALCSPSRASILTGTYSHVNGVTTLVTPIDASQPTFVSELKNAGYRTAVVGKWHMGEGPGHNPENFDYWDVLVGHEGQGEYWNPLLLSEHGERIVEGYATDVLTDLALRWVDGLDGDDPWCLLIYHKAPHRPWDPDPKHENSFTSPIPRPENFDDDLSTRSSSARRGLMRLADNLNRDDLKVLPPEGLTYDETAQWKYQRFMEDYLACVASLDDNVGRVIDWLRTRGDFADTLLMYASDQGFFLGEHGWFDKRFMYEESLRMPFVLSYPRMLESGEVFDGMVTNVDFAQTILDAAGLGHHPRMQGTSFWDSLRSNSGTTGTTGVYYRYWEHDDVFHHAPAHYGYRTERYKLIYFYNDGLDLPGTGSFTYPPEWELYDLERDPNEMHNVYAHPAYRAVRDDLARAMWLEQAQLGDVPHPSQPRPAGLDGPHGAADSIAAT